MTIKHKHHIIPRHMGGTDDPINLVELTIEEHAEAHKILFEKYRKIEDKLAWLALSGLISKSEILKEMYQEGRKKADIKLCEKYGPNYQKVIRKLSSAFFNKKHSEETKQKMRKSKNVKEKNSQFGTCWITNGSINKKIKNHELIPKGWYKGRKIRSVTEAVTTALS